MNMIFSDDFTQGIAFGIIITCIVMYLLLQELSRHSFSKHFKRLVKQLSKQAEPKSILRKTSVATNLGNPEHPISQNAFLDLRSALILLEFYKQLPTPELLQQIKEVLKKRAADGSNYLHQYLAEYSLELNKPPEIAVVSLMLKITPRLLFETDIEGNTPLHIAEQYRHTEIAEFLIDKQHYKDLSLRYDFLKLANRYGFTALHNAAYLWRYHPEHFLKLLESCPPDSLFWQDKYGRKVYEFFVANNTKHQQQIMAMLKYKLEHNIYLGSPLAANMHPNPSLTELYVNNYQDFIRTNKVSMNLPTRQIREDSDEDFSGQYHFSR